MLLPSLRRDVRRANQCEDATIPVMVWYGTIQYLLLLVYYSSLPSQ